MCIRDRDIDPLEFYPAYVETYLERDIRQELGVAKIEEFSRFIQLCALRSGAVSYTHLSSLPMSSCVLPW